MKSSILALIICAGVLLFCFFKAAPYKEKDAIRHDMTAYYAYLPALFTYQDITFRYTDTFSRNQNKYEWLLPVKNGKVPRMTMGISWLAAPFYGTAALADDDSGGHSAHYYLFVLLAPLCYVLLGLAGVRKVLLRYTSERVTALVVLLLCFGTNLFYYTLYEGLMSHACLFFLYAWFFYFSLAWQSAPSRRNSILAGLAWGMMILIRPIHVLAILFLLLYDIQYPRQRLIFLLRNIPRLVILGICALLVLAPQLAYWKYMTGDLLFYSYGEEGFFFSDPMILQGLFGFRKGWLVYTPLMLFSLAGFYFLYKKYRELFWAYVVFFTVYVWVVFSWWCWWYGGSFGSRPLIDIYALMALPLALCIQAFLQLDRKMICTVLVSAMLVWFNYFQTGQYRKTLLHWDAMNREAYFAIFLKQHFPQNYDALLTPPDYNAALKGQRDQ